MRITRIKVLLTTIVLSMTFISVDLFAYWPLGTDDAGVGPLGVIEVKARYDMGREKDSNSHSIGHELLVGLGRVSLALSVPYKLNGADEGLSGVTAFGKLLCFGKDNSTGMLTLKTVYNSREYSNDSYDLLLLGSKTIITPLLAHVNIGWKNDFDNSYLTYGMALDYKIIDMLNVVAEITGEYNTNTQPVKFLGGFIIKPIDTLAIHIAAGAGITKDADDVVVTLGTTFTFKDKI